MPGGNGKTKKTATKKKTVAKKPAVRKPSKTSHKK